jgi:glycosyltransferase involved in cell wall biosynthesis
MVGMGGSALRTMAFGVPLVVMGERGFSRVLDEDTLPVFLRQGWYGLGDGSPDDLVAQLERLLVDPLERKRLGELGCSTVAERYDLTVAAGNLEDWYRAVATERVPSGRAVLEAARTVGLRTARAAQQSAAGRLATSRRRG